MDPMDKELLILRRPELVDNIDITNGLLTHLLSRKVLNQRMVQSITYNKPPDRQVEELLDLLPKRGSNAFKLFCDALIATDQEDVVSSFLQKKADTESSLSSSSSVATASVPASPLPLAVPEAADVHIPSSVPSSVSVLAGPSTSLTSSVQESAPPASDVPSLSLSPLKRKPETSSGECLESEEKLRRTMVSPSETDSFPAKCVQQDSSSVICIHGGNENVIKIYKPATGEMGDSSVTKSGAVQESVPFPSLMSNHGATSSQAGLKTEEIRHVMKHFILKDSAEDSSQEEHIRVAKSMLSELPQQYLKLMTESYMSPSKLRREEDLSGSIMRERLSRCDSTDTMETRIPDNAQADVSRKQGAEVDQPDQSVVSIQNVVAALPSGQLAAKSVDCTDGHISVHVEECSRNFYNQFKDKSYRMLGMPRGQALIINVNEVAEKPPRRGTDIDRDNLTNLLSQLHFQVTAYNDEDDLTALGIAEKLRDFANKAEHESADACIICLLSHGEEGYMFGTDGKKIPLDEVFLLFDNRRCPALLNKPKIFFIQACRGGMLDQGVKVMADEPDGGPPMNNNFQQHPSMSDMLICYPTLQGYYAWRNREKGSWYIEAVVKIFMKFAKTEDVCAMLNRVNSSVSRKVSRTPQTTMDRMSQMSEYKSSLRRPYLFFFPGIGSPIVQ